MAHRRKQQKRHFCIPQQPPARAQDAPFCGYFGPNGESCSETTHLEKVFSMTGAGLPDLAWMACPLHQEDVVRLAHDFQRRRLHTPQSLTFTYHGTVTRMRVASPEQEPEETEQE
ncbi:MAG: hypothetical protein ACRDHZ_19770 [Ktedonobacteraceae bacterium]